jgi:hypothetical protein
MTPDPLLARLQPLAAGFSCRYWSCVAVASPEEHRAKAAADFEYNPSRTAATRLEGAQDKYAVIFHCPKAPDWRGELPGSRPIEAVAAFTEDARNLSDAMVRRYFLGVILERGIHEVLESAQVKSAPNVPIVDPHTDAQILDDRLTWDGQSRRSKPDDEDAGNESAS